MGKVPYYPDSETDASSSAEITKKKKKKFSILKYTKRSVKKKCKAHSLPDMEEPEYPVQNKKLRGILKHDITRDFSAVQESSSIAQELIAQYLLNKETCCSETQFSEYRHEPQFEIIYDNKPLPGTIQYSSSFTSGQSLTSLSSFTVDDENTPAFSKSEDRSQDDVDNVESCLMIGLVIGKALTCMSKEKRYDCLRKLSNYFKQHTCEQYKHCRNSDLYSASEEDLTDVDIPMAPAYPVGKCLVGRVPRPPGGRPNYCGGVAIIVRKNPWSGGPLRAQASVSGSRAQRSMMNRLCRKKSF